MTTQLPELEQTFPEQVTGRSVLRSEDRAMLTGAAAYLDDVPREGAWHRVFVRSPVAHAVIRSVDAEEGRAKSCVMGVFAGPGTAVLRLPRVEDSPETFARHLLAND